LKKKKVSVISYGCEYGKPSQGILKLRSKAMGTDVAAFAKQLKEDGIDAARKEADSLLSDANQKGKKIIADAKIEAEKMLKDAELEITNKKHRSEAEMQLVARDLMNGLKKRIEDVGAALLKGKVAEQLNTEEVIKSSISELLKNQETGKEWELALGKKVAKPLAGAVVSLFKEKGATARMAEELNKAGFELRSDSGTEVIEVTEDSVTEAFKKLLSPELKKIIEKE
jgi:V/A-type H+-transporting ATPase subunit E